MIRLVSASGINLYARTNLLNLYDAQPLRAPLNRPRAPASRARSISDKTLQAAEGKWLADRANAEAAKITLKTQQGVIQQQWGKVISKWVFEHSPRLERLAERQDLLLRITLPKRSSIPTAPSTIQVQALEGAFISARLVSPSPNTDPRIQGCITILLLLRPACFPR